VLAMQHRRLSLAMGEVVGEDGLENVTVARVCKRAGMSRRTFYELFEDREACFLAAFDAAIERIANSIAPVYERERRWRDGVRAALGVLLECFDAEPGMARLCVVETLKAGPQVLEHRRRVLDALSAYIEEGRREAKGSIESVPLVAESTVGGVLSIIHARLLSSTSPVTGNPRTGIEDPPPLVGLLNALMSMIVHPYLGPAAAKRELETRVPQHENRTVKRPASNSTGSDPFRDLPIRFTYRTARVLATIAAEPGASNREIGTAAGVQDQGQMSKLLRRLQRNGLIENQGQTRSQGEPNAWALTERGRAVHTAIDAQATA
jgi:AcrR family transcriptional regulator/DNA-binding MarR family transcriptional regulator